MTSSSRDSAHVPPIRPDASNSEPASAGWAQFEPIYDEHHVRLYRFALLLCNGRRAVAEDAVAEAFVLVYEAWRSGRAYNVFGYVWQTLINGVFGRHRHESVARRFLEARHGDDRGRRDADEQAVERLSMFEYLERLPGRQRAAVILRFYEDMSYEQIAITLDVSVGTAKSHVSAGVQRLRELMEPSP